jgi:hypothetical protein
MLKGINLFFADRILWLPKAPIGFYLTTCCEELKVSVFRFQSSRWPPEATSLIEKRNFEKANIE